MRTDLLKPYNNYIGPKPDEHSVDFQQVMAWLVARGAPNPTVSYEFINNGFDDPRSGQNPGPIMYLTFGPTPTPTTFMDACLVLNTPGAALLMLAPFDPKIDYQYAPPKLPDSSAGSLPPTQPLNPVGVLWRPSDENGNRVYYSVTGDTLPEGTIWPNPTAVPRYRKGSISFGAFGNRVFWTEVSAL